MKTRLVPIHRAGWPFIVLFAAAAIVMAAFSELLGFAGTVLTVWCVYFFRNPDRVTPERDGLIISPADGIVLMIDQAASPKELGMGEGLRSRVAVFMNVFDVHVNRVPLGGTITALYYRPGKFLNASLDKTSEFNERQSLRLTMADGRDMAFVQIAGLIARRIVSDPSEGDAVVRGDRIGLIRFGSRVDLFIPLDWEIFSSVGDRVRVGSSVLARLPLEN